MNRLAVDFAGLALTNPFLLASGPSTRNAIAIKQALKAGWAGIVTKTISFQPTISPTPRLYMYDDTDSLINIELISEFSPRQWARWIKRLKKQFPRQVIIASIMGSIPTRGVGTERNPVRETNWENLAKIMEQSGADALELNVSCPHGMPEQGMGGLIGQDKNLVAEVTASVTKTVQIPVIVKLTPNVTDISEIARACEEAGADALSGINTVKAFAGIDIDTFLPKLSVYGYSAYGGYGGRAIKPIALRGVAEMLHSTTLPVSAIGGITTWADAVEFLLLGASSVQICTAAISYGINIIEEFQDGLKEYLKKHKFVSVRSIIGKAKNKVVEFSKLSLQPRQFPIINKNKCIENCEICLIACRSIGFDAIQLGKHNRPVCRRGRPVIRVLLCKGCGLCLSVCPYNAIKMKPCKRK